MTVAACTRDMIPALTKPMTMTVVAPELWIAAVVTAPIPTPTSLLPDTLWNSVLNLSELTASRLELIILHATRNIPIPASMDRMAEIITAALIGPDDIIHLSFRLKYLFLRLSDHKKDFATEITAAKSRSLQQVPGIILIPY